MFGVGIGADSGGCGISVSVGVNVGQGHEALRTATAMMMCQTTRRTAGGQLHVWCDDRFDLVSTGQDKLQSHFDDVKAQTGPFVGEDGYKFRHRHVSHLMAQ
ncbi:MAG: hypothetical protein GPOALKHO_001541 [Sodalis sp.]|nr:MAG: hypothetical protein GPOALKHO_001541 [Sodalis sp.]